jgi:hypothetical protein
MMNQLDILEAVKAKVLDSYNYPIYLDETKEGFQSPCFFLKALRTTNRDNCNYHVNYVSVYVTFFAEKGTILAEDLYAIQDTLFNSFTYGFYLLNERRFLLTENIHAEIDGEDSDLITFSFDVKYFDHAPVNNGDYEIMNTLHVNERYK